MKAYVINLESRPDRWQGVTGQRKDLGFEIERIIAVSMSDVNDTETYVAAGVAATWASHQRAMKTFLESNDDYGLIMEDDFLITKSWGSFDIELLKKLQIDFLQLGFLITSPIDAGIYTLLEIWDFCLKFLNRLGHLPLLHKLPIFNRFIVKEQDNVPWGVVPHNIRPGGQSYIVSRKFAKAALNMNTPTFNTTDAFYMSIGDVRTFRMYRMRRNLIKQSNSPSSVEKRFV